MTNRSITLIVVRSQDKQLCHPWTPGSFRLSSHINRQASMTTLMRTPVRSKRQATPQFPTNRLILPASCLSDTAWGKVINCSLRQGHTSSGYTLLCVVAPIVLIPDCCTGGQDSRPVDMMNRQPSLAAGISGAGFEWNPSPSRTPPSVPSDLNTESHLAFASAPADDSNSRPAQSTFASQSQAGTGADTPASSQEEHKSKDEDTVGEDQAEGSSMSADKTQAEEAGAGSLFSTMQTRAPGLTPLRLTPKTEPAQPRSAGQSCHHRAPFACHPFLPM